MPGQLKKALKVAEQEGHFFADFHCSWNALLQANRTGLSAEKTLRSFLEKEEASQGVIDKALEALSADLSEEIVVKPVEGAKELLLSLKGHQLAIVSRGRESLQRDKLEKAGLDVRCFSKIMITPVPNKQSCYQKILFELGRAPGETIVVGDRLEVDLSPAKALGCYTVQIMRGRAFFGTSTGHLEGPDEKIDDLGELISIVDNLKSR